MITMHDKDKPSTEWLIEAMQYVRKQYGVSYAQQVRDIFNLRNQLEPHRYYYYRLYDPSLTAEEKRAFVGYIMQEAMMLACNPFTWWQALSDKLASAALLRANDIRVPKILAVVDKRRRDHAARHFANAADAADWLMTEAPVPSFGKLINGTKGEKSFALLGREDGVAIMGRDERLDRDGVEKLFEGMIARGGAIIQEKLEQHPAVTKRVGPHIASSRITVLYKPDGPKIWNCGWRIPTGGAVADNYSQGKNLYAALDIETGEVTHAIRTVKGYDIELVETHPDTNERLIGFALPDWRDALELTRKAAHLYANVGLQSWDVAFTTSGPAVLEVNPGGNLDNPQKLDHKGLWQGEIKDFVQECFKERRNAHVRFPWKKVNGLING